MMYSFFCSAVERKPSTMSLRGKACIIGTGETPHRRNWPGRTERGLCAEAAAMAITDAGLRKEDVDGIITYGGAAYPGPIAEYAGIRPIHYAAGVSMMGSSAGAALATASAVVNAGIARYILCVFGGGRDTEWLRGGAVTGPNTRSEFEAPYGLAVAANTMYGLLYTRHMYEYGTKPEQLAKLAVNQRFNALKNPRSAFAEAGAITVEDVLNSRYVNYPLHLLECVMPVAGAIAYIVSSAEDAKTAPNPPVYVLGVGVSMGYASSWTNPQMTTLPVAISGRSAYQMAGYGPKDIQFANVYD